MKRIGFRAIGKEVVMSGFVLAYALTGSYPAVANVAPVAPHIAAYICEHPAPPAGCRRIKGGICVQDRLACATPVCEHAAPPPGCSWVAGATCLQDRLACTNLFAH